MPNCGSLVPKHQSDDEGYHHSDTTRAPRADAFANLYGVAVYPDGGAVSGIRSCSDGKGGRYEAHGCDQHGISHPQTDPRAQLCPNHALETKLAIPHDIGDELRECEEQADDDGERQHHAYKNLAAVRRFARMIRTACNARARRPLRRHIERRTHVIVTICFNVEDDRIVIAGTARALPAGTIRAVFRIEHGAKHIKERHANSLAIGEERHYAASRTDPSVS